MWSSKEKQAVSIRLSEGMYAISNAWRRPGSLRFRHHSVRHQIMLNRVSPLCDDAIRGRIWCLCCRIRDELIRYFEIDAYRLETIINEQAGATVRVDRDDIALLAMSGLREEYLPCAWRAGVDVVPEGVSAARSLRNYLYDKYVYRNEQSRRVEPAPAP